MILNTERLIVRPLANGDLEKVHALHTIAAVDEYNTLGIPKDLEETRGIVSSWVAAMKESPVKNHSLVITLETTGEFLGLFGLKLGNEKYRRGEIWYKLHPDYWGKGYATEAVKGVLEYGFEVLKLHRITAGCAVGNTASIRVLEKAGMTREGRMRQILPLKSGWSDNFEYGILETDRG